MKNIPQIVFAVVLLLSLVSCSKPNDQAPAQQNVQSNKERVTSPKVVSSDLAELAKGNGAFALDLYHVLRRGRDNLFYSPYSISVALAMTYAGARGETERQMADALHYTLPQDRLHPAFNALDLALASRGEGAQGKDGQPFRLHVANAIWGQTGYTFVQGFLDVLAVNYGAGLKLLDFTNAPEPARVTINDWVSEQTEDRIKDLIPAGAIDTLTRLVLTNAIYFNAAWRLPFQSESTEDGPFHLLGGDEVTVPMMKQIESFGYSAGKGYEAVELLYDGRELSMVLLVPDAGAFETFEDTLDADRVESILKDLSPTQVALSMPRFKIESSFSLVDALAALGMPEAFSESADFSGMTGNRELSISDIIHKAFVSVDETGTEAAAATAVIIKLVSAPAEPVPVNVDRPFIFAIRDIKTGALLFVGRVLDPSA